MGLQKGTRSKNDTITAFRSVPEQIVAGVSIVQNFFRACRSNVKVSGYQQGKNARVKVGGLGLIDRK